MSRLTSELKRILRQHVADINIDVIDYLAEKQQRAEYLALIADSDGNVCVCESGRDCDGVVYSGHKTVIPANIMVFERLENERGEWADGPFHLTIVSTREAKSVEYTSRDTFAEAMNY